MEISGLAGLRKGELQTQLFTGTDAGSAAPRRKTSGAADTLQNKWDLYGCLRYLLTVRESSLSLSKTICHVRGTLW